MIDREYTKYNYKPLKLRIGAIIKNPEMLRLVSDHRKTKKICNHAVEKLSFVINIFLINVGHKKCFNVRV